MDFTMISWLRLAARCYDMSTRVIMVPRAIEEVLIWYQSKFSFCFSWLRGRDDIQYVSYDNFAS
jgi:hypothetical protein